MKFEKEIFFIKAHGAGNDFIIIDEREKQKNLTVKEIQFLCHRKFGIGADQLILIRNSAAADCEMIIHNQNGSQAEACGNATRCVAKIISQEQGIAEVKILVSRRIINVKSISKNSFMVNMGKAELQEPPGSVAKILRRVSESIFLVNVSNPHLVIFVKNMPDKSDIKKFSQALDLFFENGINVNFVEILEKNKIKLVTHERGSGFTLACGSGATASVYAGIMGGILPRDSKIATINEGGVISITLDENENLLMEGPAEIIFQGRIDRTSLSSQISLIP